MEQVSSLSSSAGSPGVGAVAVQGSGSSSPAVGSELLENAS